MKHHKPMIHKQKVVQPKIGNTLKEMNRKPVELGTKAKPALGRAMNLGKFLHPKKG